MIGIIGAAESGVGAAILGMKHGNEVFLSEKNEIADRYKSEIKKYNIPFEERGHDIDILSKSELIVKSPGVPGDVQIIRQLRGRGIPIISELEWAWRHMKGRVAALTGSNGKTTTAKMTAHLLRKLGKNTVLCGNMGYSAARACSETESDYWVLEASSFQLDDIADFRPNVSVLLNLSPDHLDRYESMSDYAYAKAKIWSRQQQGDQTIFNADDQMVAQLIDSTQPQSEIIPVRYEQVDSRNWESFGLLGSHNKMNALCAMRTVECLLQESIDWGTEWQGFKAPEHRLEAFWERDGVLFINDSKGTNLDATRKALEAVESPIVLILGGVDKGNDYAEISDLIEAKVRRIIALGKDNAKIIEAFSDRGVQDCKSLEEMKEVLLQTVQKGDRVLLSPACASFDLFDNYRDRGKKFKNVIEQTFNKN